MGVIWMPHKIQANESKTYEYVVDPFKLLNARAYLEHSNRMIDTLQRAKALHRLAGDIGSVGDVVVEIHNIKMGMITTQTYVKGMEIVLSVQGGDLTPFVNLMANTYQTNNMELRQTAGKWTLFINGQEDPTINYMTVGEIVNYIGVTYEKGYKVPPLNHSEPNRQNVDTNWDWDQFYNKSNLLVWACRGVQTGQFAPLNKCSYKNKNDQRWPNK